MKTAPCGAASGLTVHLAERYLSTMYIGKLTRKVLDREITFYLREYPDGKRIKLPVGSYWAFYESTEREGLATRYESEAALHESFAKFKDAINEPLDSGWQLAVVPPSTKSKA